MILQRIPLRAALACALAGPLLSVAVPAGPPMETNKIVDGTSAPLGTIANPFMVGTMPFTRSGDPLILPVTSPK